MSANSWIFRKRRALERRLQEAEAAVERVRYLLTGLEHDISSSLGDIGTTASLMRRYRPEDHDILVAAENIIKCCREIFLCFDCAHVRIPDRYAQSQSLGLREARATLDQGIAASFGQSELDIEQRHKNLPNATISGLSSRIFRAGTFSLFDAASQAARRIIIENDRDWLIIEIAGTFAFLKDSRESILSSALLNEVRERDQRLAERLGVLLAVTKRCGGEVLLGSAAESGDFIRVRFPISYRAV